MYDGLVQEAMDDAVALATDVAGACEQGEMLTPEEFVERMWFE